MSGKTAMRLFLMISKSICERWVNWQRFSQELLAAVIGARAAGLWHDLGKYKTHFQQRIKSVPGYDGEAHLEGFPGRVDHSTAGA